MTNTFNNLCDFQQWLNSLHRPYVVDEEVVILEELSEEKNLKASEGSW